MYQNCVQFHSYRKLMQNDMHDGLTSGIRKGPHDCALQVTAAIVIDTSGWQSTSRHCGMCAHGVRT